MAAPGRRARTHRSCRVVTCSPFADIVRTGQPVEVDLHRSGIRRCRIAQRYNNRISAQRSLHRLNRQQVAIGRHQDRDQVPVHPHERIFVKCVVGRWWPLAAESSSSWSRACNRNRGRGPKLQGYRRTVRDPPLGAAPTLYLLAVRPGTGQWSGRHRPDGESDRASSSAATAINQEMVRIYKMDRQHRVAFQQKLLQPSSDSPADPAESAATERLLWGCRRARSECRPRRQQCHRRRHAPPAAAPAHTRLHQTTRAGPSGCTAYHHDNFFLNSYSFTDAPKPPIVTPHRAATASKVLWSALVERY